MEGQDIYIYTYTYSNIPRLVESSQPLHQNDDESMAFKVKIKSAQQIQSAVFFREV